MGKSSHGDSDPLTTTSRPTLSQHADRLIGSHTIAKMADREQPVTLRTRKFIRNPLLGRKQMVVDILHPNRANISKDELRGKLAEMYKANKDQVNVFGLQTQFGGGKTTGFALVYDSPEALKKFEPHYRLVKLKDRDYLVGPGKGKYSIADIASFSWVNVSQFAGVDLAKFPNVERWWKSIVARPAVKAGLAVPSESRIVNEAYLRRLKEEDGFKEAEDKLKDLGDKAKEQYGYKFASP